MTERRGTRSRVTEESLKDAPLGGSPSDARDDALSDDEGTQDSRSSRMRGGNTNNGTRTEHPDADSDPDKGDAASDSSHSPNGFTDEESAEWKELLNLRKGKRNADQKITQQGQENAQLRTENDELTQRVGRLERNLAHLLSNGATTEPSAADDSGAFGGDSEDDFDPNSMQVMQRVVGRLHDNQKRNNEEFAQLKADQAYEKEVSHLMQNLGVSQEAAEVLIDVFQEGDILSFAKAYELSSLPAEVRATARTARQQRRDAAAIGHPTSTVNAPYAPTEGDMEVRQTTAKKLMGMKDGKSKRDAIIKALDDDPEIFEQLAQESGFNFL